MDHVSSPMRMSQIGARLTSGCTRGLLRRLRKAVVLFSVFSLFAEPAFAATTIGLNVSTGGTLTVGSTASFQGTVSVTDGNIVDLSAIQQTAATDEGLRLPVVSAQNQTPTTGSGYLAWSTASSSLMYYDGAAWISVATTTSSGSSYTGDSTFNLYPNANRAYGLGTHALSWNNLYASGTASVGEGILAPSLDRITAGTLSIGTATSTAITIGYSTATTTFPGGVVLAGTGGSVGIGIASPSTKLEVVGTVSSTAIVTGDIDPRTNNLSDLGSFGTAWKDVYASGTIYAGTGTEMTGTTLILAKASGFNTGRFYVDSSGNVNASGTFRTASNVFASGNLSASGSLNVTGNVTSTGNIYAQRGVVVAGNVTSTGSMYPSANNSADLGAYANAWKDIFASGTSYLGNIVLSGTCTGSGCGSNYIGASAFDLRPTTNNTYDLGYATSSWNDLYVSGTAYLAGTNFGGALTPKANNSYDIGAYANAWKDVYVSGTIYSSGAPLVNGTRLSYQGYAENGSSRRAVNLGEYLNREVKSAIVSSGKAFTDIVFDGRYVWASDLSGVSNQVRKIDPVSGDIVASVTVGSDPFNLVFDGRYVWAVNYSTANISKIDTLNDSVVATVSGFSAPRQAIYDGQHIWVADEGADAAIKVDPTSNSIVSTVQLNASSAPEGLVFDGRYVWVGQGGSTRVNKIDVSTDRTVATTTVGSSPLYMAFDGSSVWVGNQASDTVSKIDPVTNEVLATVLVGGNIVDIAWDGAAIAVANGGFNAIAYIDPVRQAVIATSTLNAVSDMAAVGRDLWVSSGWTGIERVSSKEAESLAGLRVAGYSSGTPVSVYSEATTTPLARLFASSTYAATGLDAALRIDASRAASGLYNLLALNVGVTGTPSTVFRVDGMGSIFTSSTSYFGAINVTSCTGCGGFTGAASNDIFPTSNNAYNLGYATSSWKDLYVSGTAYLAATNFGGALTPKANNAYDIGAYGSSWKDLYSSGTAYLTNASVATSLKPTANNTVDLGSFGTAWKDVYASGTIYISSTSVLDSNSFKMGMASSFLAGKFYVNSLGDMAVSGTSYLASTTLSDGSLLDLGNISNSSGVNEGFKLPQAASLGNPSSGAGFLAFDTDNPSIQYYDGAAWISVVTTTQTVSLQGAYDGGNVVTSTDSADVRFVMSDTATDPNFDVNLQASSTIPSVATTTAGEQGVFRVRTNNQDLFRVDSYGTSSVFGTLNVNTPWNVRLTKTIGVSGVVLNYAEAISGNYIFVPDGARGGVSIFDISRPEQQSVAVNNAVSPTIGRAFRFQVVGRYLYSVASTDGTNLGFSITDISDIRNPRRIGNVDTPVSMSGASSAGLAIVGRYAYVSIYGNGGLGAGMYVYDISDPNIPMLVGRLNSSWVYDLKVRGRYLYLVGDGLLQSVDISDPTNPISLQTVSTGVTIVSADLSGRYLYAAVADGSTEFRVYDVSNPASMTLLGSSGSPFACGTWGLKVRGSLAYAANRACSGSVGRFNVWDVSSSTKPLLLKSVLSSTYLRNVETDGRHAYAISETAGSVVSVFDLNGAEISSANIGSLQTDGLDVNGDVNVDGDLDIRGALSVGGLGMRIDGALDISNFSSTGTTALMIDQMPGATSTVPAVQVNQRATSSPAMYLYAVNGGYQASSTGGMLRLDTDRVTSTAFNFLTMNAAATGTTSTVFRVDGMGSIFTSSTSYFGEINVTSCVGCGGSTYIGLSAFDLYPDTNDTYDLGYATSSWNNLYVSGTAYLAATNFGGALTPKANNSYDVGGYGSAWNDVFSSGTAYLTNAQIATSLNPAANNTVDLGAYGTAWKDIYASGTLYIGSTSVLDSNSFKVGTAGSFLAGRFYVDSSGNVNASGSLKVAGNVTSTGSMYPSANNVADLGAYANAWKDVFSSGSAYLTNGWVSARLNSTANNSADLGAYANAWKDIYSSGTAYLTNVVVNGTCTGCGGTSFIGASAFDLRPTSNDTYDLGYATSSWKDVYVSGTIYTANYPQIKGVETALQGFADNGNAARAVLGYAGSGQLTHISTTTGFAAVGGMVVVDHFLLVTDPGADVVRFADTVDDTVYDMSIPVGSLPNSAVSNGVHIWVTNAGSDNISRISFATLGVTATTTLTTGATPHGIAYDGTYLWVANTGNDTVNRIDASTGLVNATTTVGDTPERIVFDGRWIWVTSAVSGTVSKIDRATAAVVSTITLGYAPFGIVFDGANIWVANQTADALNKIDPIMDRVVATTTLIAGTGPRNLAFDGESIVSSNLGTTFKVDPVTNVVTASSTVGYGSDVGGLVTDGYTIFTVFDSSIVRFSNRKTASFAGLRVDAYYGGVPMSIVARQSDPLLHLMASNTSFSGGGNDFGVLVIDVNNNDSTGYNYIAARIATSSRNTVFRVRGDGQIFSDAGTTITQPADLAELTTVKAPFDDYPDGTIVTQSSEDEIAEVADSLGDPFLGIATDRGAFMGSGRWGGEIGESTSTIKVFERDHMVRRIAISGYIMIRVNDENGPIRPGDALALSSTPGEARKALPGDSVIGMARAHFPPKQETDLPGEGGAMAEVTSGDIEATYEDVLAKHEKDKEDKASEADTLTSDGGQADGEVATSTVEAVTLEEPIVHGLVESVIGNGAGVSMGNVLQAQGRAVSVDGSIDAGAATILSSGTNDIAQLVVRDVASFHGELRVKGHAYWNEDMAGLAKFLKGSTEVKVSFGEPYSVAPVVTVAPRSDTEMNWWVDSETAEGFVIRLRGPVVDRDLEFSWHAIAVPEPRLYVSDSTHGPVDKEYIWRDTGTRESQRYRDLRYSEPEPESAPPATEEAAQTDSDEESASAEPSTESGTEAEAPADQPGPTPPAEGETPVEVVEPSVTQDASLPGHTGYDVIGGLQPDRTGFDAVGGPDEEIPLRYFVPFLAFTRA